MTNSQLAAAPLAAQVSSARGRIQLETLPDRCVIHFTGEIDAAIPWDALERLAQVVRSSSRPVQVNCSRVTFFGAEGLSMLALLKHAAPAGQLAALTTNATVDLVLGVYPRGTYTRGRAS